MPILNWGATGSTYLGSIWTTHSIELGDACWITRVIRFPRLIRRERWRLAYSLGRLYPRGRLWFYVLAGLCAMNRIDGGAHFASDVCWGAALGYLMAVLLPTADRMEAWVDRAAAQPPTRTQQAAPPVSKAA